MTQVKENGTSLFPSLTDLFDSDKWLQPDRFFKGFHANLPAANVSETEKEFKIEMAIPGFKKEEVKVNLDNEVLTVSAESKNEREENTKKYTRKEFSYGTFTRSFQLPKAVIADKIEAKYENGLLKLAIPKKEEAYTKASKEIRVD